MNDFFIIDNLIRQYEWNEYEKQRLDLIIEKNNDLDDDKEEQAVKSFLFDSDFQESNQTIDQYFTNLKSCNFL